MKYNELRKKCVYPMFSLQDLRLLGLKIFGYQLSLWKKEGLIIKLKNGIYAFADRINDVLPEEAAKILYSPSYISLERAMYEYGMIPEIVYSVTSITPKATRYMENMLGKYNYRHISKDMFFGYKEVRKEGHVYLLAEPEKALIDYFYFNLKDMRDKDDLKEVRLDYKSLKKEIAWDKATNYLKKFRGNKGRKLKRILSWIKEAANADA